MFSHVNWLLQKMIKSAKKLAKLGKQEMQDDAYDMQAT